MFNYVKEAFNNKYNLLFIGAGLVFSIISPSFIGSMAVLLAFELAYLSIVPSMPRFQRLIKTRLDAEKEALIEEEAQEKLSVLTGKLNTLDRNRFNKICAKCKSLGQKIDGVDIESVQIPDVDRLLWMYLKLLVAKQEVSYFLNGINENELIEEEKSLKKRLDAITESDNIAEQKKLMIGDMLSSTTKRIENFSKVKGNVEIFELKLEQIERKLSVLAEQAINRNDPTSISGGIDAITRGVELSENTIADLKSATGISLIFEEPPSILSSFSNYDKNNSVSELSEFYSKSIKKPKLGEQRLKGMI